jgi:hypothetical protein
MKIKTEINVSTGELTITGGAGESVRRRVFHRERAHLDTRAYAEMHGWKQRVIDSAAVERTDEEGRLVPDELRDATQWTNICSMIDHYESGTADWSIRAPGQGGDGGLLVKAMVRAGAAEEAARAAVKSMDRKTQNAMLTHEKLRDHVAAIREELGRGVDVSGALSELGI